VRGEEREQFATKMMPSTSVPRRTGTPRNPVISGCAGGQPSNLGSALMSVSRSGAPDFSSAASIPCCRGSGPIARCLAREIPSVTNSANEPRSSGTPSAAYRASTRVRADRTIAASASRVPSVPLTASTAWLTERSSAR
jgi:hypothetical protein